MKLRFLALAVSLGLSTVAAHAQGGIYVNPMATYVTNSVADTGYFAFLGQNSKSQFFEGATIGGFYDFAHGTKVSAGIDVRDAIQHGNGASLNSFLVGVHIAPNRPKSLLQPYAQAYVGAGTTKAPTSLIHVTKLQYGVLAGVDYNASRHVGFRLIEVGYAPLTTMSSAIVGGTTSIPSARLLSFSAGLVFRLPEFKSTPSPTGH
jgi:hypothetical protein